MGPKFFTTKRMFLSIVFGLLVGIFSSEVPFLFLHDTMRAPREIVLTIPAGTAQQVALGEQPPSIPENMTFVVGDRLVVRNEDTVDHKLGPFFIPAHSSTQLALNQEESLAYECTFQAGKYFGLQVNEPLTTSTRIFGIVYIAFPMAILFALYSFLVPKKKENVPA
ncbi:MAG TPA: hypothetical protein VLE49_18590 [Anaerolineales bacterium]|nr:hypothetical protein [Anaerolineales bacterium]